MNSAILWKEYRQHRHLWMAMTILAALLLLFLGVFMGKGSGLAIFSGALQANMNTMLTCLAVAYGVIVGALLLAGEVEDGTLPFLDGLVGVRQPIWSRKLIAGALFTFLQCLVLIGMALALGFASWNSVFHLPIMGLDAFAFGLLGGAWRRTVLGAVLTGIAFMAVSWFLSLAVGNAWALAILLQTLVAVVAVYGSWRLFCRDDFSRNPVRIGRSKRAEPTGPAGPSSWRVLFRLVVKQGRWEFIGVMVSAVVLSWTIHQSPLVAWPISTLVLGLACGLSAFLPDQDGGKQFLAAQRAPLGRFWTVKTFCWAMALVGATAVVWHFSTGMLWDTEDKDDQWSEHNGEFSYWLPLWMDQKGLTGKFRDAVMDQQLNPAVFLGFWPIVGFCSGHFFGLLARRTIIAAFLATAFAAFVAVVWAPSILLGGVAIGWVLIIPVMLLISSWFLMRPWASERLSTRRPIMGMCVLGVLTATTILGFIRQRETEVPNVGEPFDVAAFKESLGPIEKNETGKAIRHALYGFEDHRKKLEKELGQPTGLIFPASQTPGRQYGPYSYAEMVADVLQLGWPSFSRDDKNSESKDKKEVETKAGSKQPPKAGSKQPLKLERMIDAGNPNELNRWLNRMFEGPWADETQKAVRLPLGMVQDPRLAGPDSSLWQMAYECDKVAQYFIVRALQVQAHGDSRNGLNHLETALALCRQMKNNAPVSFFSAGEQAENGIFRGYRYWLQGVGPDKQLLLEARGLLERHQATRPDVANCIKAQFLVNRENFRQHLRTEKTAGKLVNAAILIPWEDERQKRIFYAETLALLRLSQEPYWKYVSKIEQSRKDDDMFRSLAAQAGLPLEDGPSSQLSAEQWGRFILDWESIEFRRDLMSAPFISRVNSERSLEAARVVTAVALYQIDRGQPPVTLEDLIPAYIASVPIDPKAGKPFQYRIYNGEEISQSSGQNKMSLAPGQALVFSESDFYFPAPKWQK